MLCLGLQRKIVVTASNSPKNCERTGVECKVILYDVLYIRKVLRQGLEEYESYLKSYNLQDLDQFNFYVFLGVSYASSPFKVIFLRN